jgi:hypothetical protein
VNFEAGALSKSLDKSRVVPFLFGVPRTAVQGPLVQFQSAGADHDDVKKLVRSMNKACDHGLDEPRLDEIFEVWWPELQTRLSKLTCTEPEIESPSRPTEEVLAEILELVRGQQKLLTNPASLFSPSDVEAMVRESLRGGDGAASWSLPVFDDLLTCWRRVQRATATEDEVPSGLAEALRRLSIPMTQVLSESRNSRGGSRELPGEL